MASIEDLRKKLYGKESFTREEKSEEPLRGYRYKPGAEPKTFWQKMDIRNVVPRRGKDRKSRLFIRLFIFSVVVFFGVAAYIGYELFLANDEVQLQIAGPEGVTAGEVAQFVVFLKNTGTMRLVDVELDITYPEHAIPVAATGEEKKVKREKLTFPSVAPGEEVKQDVFLIFLGQAGETRTMTAFTAYRPENIESRLTERVEHPVLIHRSPFVITVEAPEEVTRGQDVLVTFAVRSGAASRLASASFRIDYPEGFVYTRADPAPAFDNNIWAIGDILPGETKKITVEGTVEGLPEEVKAFHAVLGRYTPETKAWLVYLEETRGPRIASPFLLARQEINGSRGGNIDAGTRLSVSIFYKNNFSKKIADVVIAARFPENLVNLKELETENGVYNAGAHEVQWLPASVSALKELDPGESGVVTYQVPVRAAMPLQSLADKNFSLSFRASIDAKSPPPELAGVTLRYEDTVNFKVNTRLALSSRAAYFDSPVPNTGPLPPRPGQETTYTIYWQLADQANDAVNIEVRAGLPANVRWLGTVGDVPGNAVFNTASNEILWTVPRVLAGTGIIRPQTTLIFQVALTPGVNQAGSAATLVLPAKMRGSDSFTSVPLGDESRELTTELSKDNEAKQEQWRVVQ